MTEIPKSARVYVAGHRGLVGSAILRTLGKAGYTNRLTAPGSNSTYGTRQPSTTGSRPTARI